MIPHNERSIASIDELELLLSEPHESTVRALARLPGDVLVLGAGGKMGPTLARMAKTASDLTATPRRVIAVSRFPSSQLRERLQSWGIETIGCDLLDPARQEVRLRLATDSAWLWTPSALCFRNAILVLGMTDGIVPIDVEKGEAALLALSR